MTPADVVTAYACALDARDWAGFRGLFTDTIELDYGAIGSIVGPIAADAWTERCGLLGHFDATRHRLSNIRVAIDGARARVDSYIDAVHFIDGAAGDLSGSYVHELVRDGGRWRIAKVTLEVAGYPLGAAAFAAVFAAARDRQSG